MLQLSRFCEAESGASFPRLFFRAPFALRKSVDDPLITQIERQLLDVRHRNFALLRLPEDQAITRLLKMAGDILRECPGINIVRGLPPQATHTLLSTLLKALSHCIRWVCQDCVPGPPAQSPNWQREDQDTAELLGWGMHYAQLATDHVAWRQDLIKAHADPTTRTIVFEPSQEMDLDYFIRESQADFAWWEQEANDLYPVEAVSKLFRDWQSQVTKGPSGLDFPVGLIRNHRSLAEIQKWVGSCLFPELEDSCQLGHYRLSDLRCFYAHLFSLCECVRILEDRIDTQLGQENPMGTWTFQDDYPAFLAYLADLSGLPVTVLDSILCDMTLNAQRFHCSITVTPFIRSRTNRLFLLPRLFAFLSPQRTVASALISGTGRASYDRISTTLEKFHLVEIGQVLRDCGFTAYQERTFRTPLGDKLQPDFLVMDGKTSDLLVIDFKNALAATAVLEVTNRLKEYRKGIKQVEGYLDAFTRYPELLQSLASSQQQLRVFGLLLFRVPMPLPIPKGSRVAAENWHSLRHRLTSMKPTRVTDVHPRPTNLESFGNVVRQVQEIPEVLPI
jgi:hypothetical protein